MSLIISNRDALVAHAAGCLAARQAQAPAPRLRLGNISGLNSLVACSSASASPAHSPSSQASC